MTSGTSRQSKRKYVQFSKKIVVAITAAVTVICTASVVLCWMSGEMVIASDVIQAYIGYATVVFVAYSGNSAAEKWLMTRYGGYSTTDEDDTSNG